MYFLSDFDFRLVADACSGGSLLLFSYYDHLDIFIGNKHDQIIFTWYSFNLLILLFACVLILLYLFVGYDIFIALLLLCCRLVLTIWLNNRYANMPTVTCTGHMWCQNHQRMRFVLFLEYSFCSLVLESWTGVIHKKSDTCTEGPGFKNRRRDAVE